MRKVEFTVPATLDIDDILSNSEADFGSRAAVQYQRLIGHAIDALAENASHVGVRQSPDTPSDVYWFHLRSARNVPPPGERVGKPRHLIVFTLTDTHISIVRVLHDSMDIPAHLG